MKVILFAILCLNFSTIAQINWISLGEKNGVTVSYKYVQCEQFSPDMPLGIHFKWENSNLQEVEITFKPAMVFDGVCKNCELEGHEYYYTFNLHAGSTLEGQCAPKNPHHLQLTAVYDNGTERIELTDLYILSLDVSTVTLDPNDERNKVTRQEFDSMPDAKKQYVLEHPESYVIIEN